MGDLMGCSEGPGYFRIAGDRRALGELVRLIAKGEISGKLAKEIFAKMIESGDRRRAIIDREGLRQISDTDALAKSWTK